MKTATQVIFASALMLSVVAPSLSHARVVAPGVSHARDVMQAPKDIFDFMAPATRRCLESVLTRTTAGTRSPDNQRDRRRFLARSAAIFFSHATRFRFLLREQIQRANVRFESKQTCATRLWMSAEGHQRTSETL